MPKEVDDILNKYKYIIKKSECSSKENGTFTVAIYLEDYYKFKDGTQYLLTGSVEELEKELRYGGFVSCVTPPGM